MTEREIQTKGVALLRKLGAKVYVTSQRRASSVTKGVPDVMVFLPGGRGFFFWEAKTTKGKLRPAQVEFLAACQSAAVDSVWGDLDALNRHLTRLKILFAA